MLASERADDFLRELYGDEPRAWRDDLAGFDRLRVDRQRLHAAALLHRRRRDGVQGEARAAHGARGLPSVVRARAPRVGAASTIVCGHWSTLELKLAPNLLMLDSGCLWGGTLTAIRLDDRRVYQVPGRAPVTPKPFG